MLEKLIIMGVVFFLGTFFGWFFKNFKLIMMFIGMIAFGWLLDILVHVDHWMLTVPFLAGFFLQIVHGFHRRKIEAQMMRKNR